MDCTMSGLPIPHCLPEFAQVHVHWIGDAIQPSHPLLPSYFAFNLSQHQDLFQWVGSSHQVARELELLHQSFQWVFRVDFLQDLIWYINTYIWNLEKWYWWTYFQGRHRDADIENRLVDIVGEGEGGENWQSSTEIYNTTLCKIDS